MKTIGTFVIIIIIPVLLFSSYRIQISKGW